MKKDILPNRLRSQNKKQEKEQAVNNQIEKDIETTVDADLISVLDSLSVDNNLFGNDA